MKMINPYDVLDGMSYVKTLPYGQWHLYSERPEILENGIAVYNRDADSILIPAGIREIGGTPSISSWSYMNSFDVNAYTYTYTCMPREIYLDLKVFKTLDIETVSILPFRLERIIVLRDGRGLVFDIRTKYFDPPTRVFNNRDNAGMYLYILKYLLFYDVPEAKNVTNIRKIFDFPPKLFYLLVKWLLILLFIDEERFAQLFSILSAAYNKETGKTVGEGAIEYMIQTADFDFKKGIERICSLNLSREYFLYLLDFITNLDCDEVHGAVKGEVTTMVIKKLSSFEEVNDDGRFDL